MFFYDVIVNCMTACSGFKMAAQNSKWLLCDVMKRHNQHVINPICYANHVLLTCQVSSQERETFPDQKLKTSPGEIGLKDTILFVSCLQYNV